MLANSMYKEYFYEHEQMMSSTFRELRAIEEGLLLRREALRGHLVRWGCGNWAAAKIIKLGSMKPDCHEVALRIDKIVK